VLAFAVTDFLEEQLEVETLEVLRLVVRQTERGEAPGVVPFKMGDPRK
jgi:hypothetical protein